MAFTPVILAAFVALATHSISAGPIEKRETACRIDGLFVGGTPIGDGYIDVATEKECTDKCQESEKCNAVNFFPEHKACLLQEEVYDKNNEFPPSDKFDLTVYIIVKGCESSRRKREVNCKLQDVLVGGSVPDNKYIEGIDSQEACVEACNKMENCNAVNFWPEYNDCLPQTETLANAEEREGMSSRKEPGTVYIVVKGCTESITMPDNILPEVESTEESETRALSALAGRRKRDTSCRHENLFVGGTWIDGGYIENIETEEACIEECNKIETCTAVNFFPEHKACLPQVESLASEEKPESRDEEGTVYVIVKECNGGVERPVHSAEQPEETPEEPEQTRRKRDVNCRLENVLVGGTWINGGYIENIETEEACIEECNKLETCTAVNYFPEHKACLPQVETLATPDNGLASREEEGVNYVAVKGCTNGIEKPADILPPATRESGETEEPTEDGSESTSEETTENGSESESEQSQPEAGKRFKPLFGNFPFGRKKRSVECRQEKQLVGGELVGEPIDNVETEEACIEVCNKLEQCQAVNYFFEHKVCWPQVQSLATDAESLETAPYDYTTYVIVKGC